MSPTVFRKSGFRFYFFSREEQRIHIHVHGSSGEAKLWLEPQIELAMNYGLSSTEVAVVRRLVEEHHEEILQAWRKHFGYRSY